MKLSRDEIQRLLEKVLLDMPGDDCRTCDCFLGFITRLELDSQEDVRDMTDPLKTSKTLIHSCLGCNPCPPAEAYTNYIKQNLEKKPQNQPCESDCCCKK